jgi:hypothetical protein
MWSGRLVGQREPAHESNTEDSHLSRPPTGRKGRQPAANTIGEAPIVCCN